MYWGLKSRFHDLKEVLKINPQLIEFHLTDEDVTKGHLNGTVYPVDYSIHLPEYWCQVIINPCNLDDLKNNIDIYTKCIDKSLLLRNNFKFKDKLKVILHPGGMSIDKIEDKFMIDNLYKNLYSFVQYIMMIPRFSNDIEILIENMPPLPWFYGGQYYCNIFVNPDEIIDFYNKTKINICLDISHLGLYCNYVNIDIIEAIKKLSDITKQIHIADADGTDGEGAAIGEGNINFELVMKEIKNIDCAVIPEVMWGHKNNYYEFKRTMEVCNKWLI